MVPPAYRHLILPGFDRVVVDERTGLESITRDIRRGTMVMAGVQTLLLLLGRVEVRNGAEVALVMEWLLQVVRESQFGGNIVLMGLVPSPQDNRSWCQLFQDCRKDIQQMLVKIPNVHFCDAAETLSDQWGVIPQLLSSSGLTLDGCRELSWVLRNV